MKGTAQAAVAWRWHLLSENCEVLYKILPEPADAKPFLFSFLRCYYFNCGQYHFELFALFIYKGTEDLTRSKLS